MSLLNNEMVLEAHDLCISYGRKEVVHHISFSVGYGEIVAIVGASGSGKSTVLHSVAGLLPDNGKVTGGHWTFCGKNLETLDTEEKRAIQGFGMAMLFQQPGEYFNPTMKIGTQYRDFLLSHGVSKGGWRKRAEASLLLIGLSETHKVLESLPGELSGGMRQKVAAAMTFEFDPALLLVDEPTAALDSVATWKLLRRLKNYVGNRHALLIVTHDMKAACYLANRIIVMEDGRIVSSGTESDIKKSLSGSYAARLLEAVPKLR